MNPPTDSFTAIAYGAGIFLASARDLAIGARLWASLDGVRWETPPAGVPPQELFDAGVFADLTFNEADGCFYGVGSDGLIVKLGVSSSDFVPPGPEHRLKIMRAGDSLNLIWPSDPGFSYLLRYTDSLAPSSWLPIGSAIVGTGSTMSFQTTISLVAPRRFWSLLIEEILIKEN